MYHPQMPTLRIRKTTRKRKDKPDVVEYVCTFPKEIAEQYRLHNKVFEVQALNRNTITLTHSMESEIDSKGSQIDSKQLTLF